MGLTAEANHLVQSAWNAWIDELQRFLIVSLQTLDSALKPLVRKK